MTPRRAFGTSIVAALFIAVLATASPEPIADPNPAPAPEPSTPSLARGLGEINLAKRAGGYNDPAADGGSMLTIVNNTYPPGQGEPLNVIVSGDSDPQVLVDSLDNGGFQNYMLSTFLANTCLGISMGDAQAANLGDGNGNESQKAVLRWDYGDPYVGACKETFNGGLHLRYWQQGSTNAYFLAVSVEMSKEANHDIVADGYNLGRDQLVGNVTRITIPARNVSVDSTFSGNTSYGNYTYHTDVTYVAGLLQNSSMDVNHNITVEQDGYAAIDGLVAILKVSILERPQSDQGVAAASATGGSSGALATVPSAAFAVAGVALAAVAVVL